MNSKKVIFFLAFVVFTSACFSMRQEINKDTIDNLPGVKKIKEINLKKSTKDIYIEKKKLNILNVNTTENNEKYNEFYQEDLVKFFDSTIDPVLSVLRNFCHIVQQSNVIEDLCYYFFLDKKFQGVFNDMMQVTIKEGIQDPVNKCLSNLSKKNISNYLEIESFFQKTIIDEFVQPIKSNSVLLGNYLDLFLKENPRVKTRAQKLKEKLLKNIETQKVRIDQFKKDGAIDSHDKIFFDALGNLLVSFFLYISQGQGPLEEIKGLMDLLDNEVECCFYFNNENAKKKAEDCLGKYENIKRAFLVLTNQQLYDFKPIRSLSVRSQFFIFLTLFSGSAYFLYRFMPKNGKMSSLNQLFWKKSLGFSQQRIDWMFKR